MSESERRMLSEKKGEGETKVGRNGMKKRQKETEVPRESVM